MKDLWERLEVHATKHGRSLRLRPPASEAEIAAAEQVMGLAFPADFRASLLVHDGQEPGDGDAAPFEFLPGCDPLASVSAIAAQWKDEQEWAMASNGDHTPEILNTIKHPLRIPIAGTRWWDGDNTYLDLTPAAAGTVGQVVAFHSECDMTVLGPSFRGALEYYLDALDQRAWNYAASLEHVIGPEGYEDGNRSWTFGEYVRDNGRHHDANSGTHAPFSGALPAAPPAAPAPSVVAMPAAAKAAKPAGKAANPAGKKAKPAAKAKAAAKKAKPAAKPAAKKAKPARKARPAAKKAKPAPNKKAKPAPNKKAKPAAKKKPAKRR